jgi:hypothetical protein
LRKSPTFWLGAQAVGFVFRLKDPGWRITARGAREFRQGDVIQGDVETGQRAGTRPNGRGARAGDMCR